MFPVVPDPIRDRWQLRALLASRRLKYGQRPRIKSGTTGYSGISHLLTNFR